MNGFKLRQASLFNVAQMLDIERQSYSHPWTEGNFADCFKPGYEAWLYCTDMFECEIVGYVLINAAAGESHLLNICIRDQFRQQGLAKRLVAHAIERAECLGADVMFLEVRESNQLAINLYYSLGFNEIGLRKGYYPLGKERENAIVMAFQFGDELTL